MKLKIFWGCAKDVVDQFNEWAKGKALNKEVLIHEHTYTTIPPEPAVMILLFVYYPEIAPWDETKTKPIQPIHKTNAEISRLEREATGQ